MAHCCVCPYRGLARGTAPRTVQPRGFSPKPPRREAWAVELGAQRGADDARCSGRGKSGALVPPRGLRRHRGTGATPARSRCLITPCRMNALEQGCGVFRRLCEMQRERCQGSVALSKKILKGLGSLFLLMLFFHLFGVFLCFCFLRGFLCVFCLVGWFLLVAVVEFFGVELHKTVLANGFCTQVTHYQQLQCRWRFGAVCNAWSLAEWRCLLCLLFFLQNAYSHFFTDYISRGHLLDLLGAMF